MSDTAVWLTEHVLPTVPIRQWVCSLPWGLRELAGYDRELCALVVDTFVREVMRSYRWRAKRLFGLSSVFLGHFRSVARALIPPRALRVRVRLAE